MRQSHIFRAFLAMMAMILTSANAAAPATSATPESPPPPISAVADIIDSAGRTMGRAGFRQGPNGVLVDLMVTGLAPGKHGLHFHAVGACDAAGKFASAQSHMGMDQKTHGLLNPKGHHAGDLPNLNVAADGTASGQFFSSEVRISGKPGKGQMLLLDADGSSLMIHEKEDNSFDQPSGGSGGRIACGTIKSQ
jgi:superoxide dismutase, Cu-Zn family